MKNKVGSNIRNLRQEKSITQTELADKVNKSLRTIQKYETGEKRIYAPNVVVSSIFILLGLYFMGLKFYRSVKI